MRKSFFLIVLMAGAMMAQADDFEVMRQRLRERVTLGPTDYMEQGTYTGSAACNEAMASYLSELSHSAEQYRQTMRKDTTYLWDDVALLTGSKSYTPAHINESYVRLLTLARAWAYPGTSLYGDSTLLEDIRYGLKTLYNNAYSERTRIIGNWWEWRIGIPWYYANTVSILYEHLTKEEISAFEKSTAHFTYSFARYGDLTYANEASICRNLLAIGILTDNANYVETALKYTVQTLYDKTSANQRVAANKKQDGALRRQRAFARATALKNKEGLYPDGTFVQHNAIPYIATYGIEIIGMAGYMADLIPGTQFSVPQQIIDVLPTWINRAYLPAMYRGEMMLMLMGRAVDGDPYSNARLAALSIMDAATLITDSVTREASLLAAANTLAHDPHHPSPYAGIGPLPLYKPVIDSAVRMADADGKEAPFSVIWAAGDRAIHQRPDWRFCVSMSSNRIGKYECFMRATGNQNTRGWYEGDGMTYLYMANDPKQYLQYISNVNPYRLPGTTVDMQERIEEQSLQPLYGNPAVAADSARAGGVTDGEYSSAMMQLVGGKSDLRAKKSWFMLDNAVVCLGSDIRSTGDNEVITTVENRRFSHRIQMLQQSWRRVTRPQNRLFEKTQLVWMDGVGGYWFPDTAAVYVDASLLQVIYVDDANETDGGNDTDGGNTEIWLSHGVKPTDGRYAYVVLPGMTSAEAANYTKHPAVQILSNTSAMQAVRDTVLGLTAVNFWQQATFKDSLLTIGSDGAAAVLLREEGDTLRFSVSDPTWERGKQKFMLSGEWELVNVDGIDAREPYIASGGGLTVIILDQDKRLGMTETLILKKK